MINLHEYQAKNLFKKYKIPTTTGKLLTHPSQLDNIIETLGEKKLVIKAQIHAGGRGKANGIILTKNKKEAKEVTNKMLGSRLVTYQTTKEGQPVNSIYIEKLCEFNKQLYLSFVIDKNTHRITIMTSKEGGVEIEEIIKKDPNKIKKNKINAVVGIMPYQCREIAFNLDLNESQVKQMISLLQNMYKMFLENDLFLVEVNPLVITKQGSLVCLDGKIQVDKAALFRQKKLNEIRDETQENPKELHAEKMQLNYIPLGGNIGCIVNGAGLAMATMDLIKTYGGEPANFLDVGGSINEQRVIEAFELILSNKKVNSILINIFGGIVRCDIIAGGIIKAVNKTQINTPLVVRLEGNSAKKGLKLIKDSNLNIIEEQHLDKAVKKIIEISKRK